LVWRLVGGEADTLPRSACQAGYKACWSPSEGYPSKAFLNALRPGFGDHVLPRLPGRSVAPGERAGTLCADIAERFGLPADIPVSAAIIDAHAGVPGAGVGGPDTLVMVMGTSSCHMLCSRVHREVPGVAGIVRDGILPGLVGYEMGQAAVGDAFNWLQRLTGRDLSDLAEEAADLPPGADGVLNIDWFNGCRTPLMNGDLTASLHGLRLGTTPAHLYRAIAEATACGLRWIVELLREHEVPITRFVATGGLPHASPLLVQIYADVLNEPVHMHPAKHGPAVGAAILGALAAGPEVTGLATMVDAVAAMSSPAEDPVMPQPASVSIYDDVYRRYRNIAARASR
ncbi:MAG: FGGY-family carbohydrate kinase, partial [Planctomycetota bacterium]